MLRATVFPDEVGVSRDRPAMDAKLAFTTLSSHNYLRKQKRFLLARRHSI
jgi:hypothetical protein